MKDVNTKSVGKGEHVVTVDGVINPTMRVKRINRSKRAQRLYALMNANEGTVFKKGSLSDIKDHLFRRFNQPEIRTKRQEI